jgi:hypothetical protein
VVVAIAIVGPLYAQGIRENVLDRQIAEAPADRTGLWMAVQVRGGSIDDGAEGRIPMTGHKALTLLGSAASDPAVARWFGPSTGILQLDVDYRVQAGPGTDRGQGTDTRLVYRDDVCAHLTLTAGRCPASDSEVLVPEQVATAQTIRSGDTLSGFFGPYQPGGRPLVRLDDRSSRILLAPRVAGVYRAPDLDDPYWMADLGASPGPALDDAGRRPVVFASSAAFAQIRDGDVTAAIATPVRAGDVDYADRTDLRAAADTAVARSRTVPPIPTRTRIGEVLDAAAEETAVVGLVVPLGTLGVLMMAWYVLYAVVSASAQERRAEVAVARLRGRGPVAAAVLAGGEPVLLVTVGAVLGLPAGVQAARALVATVLREDVPLGVTTPGLVAGGLAYLGALVAAMAAAAAAVRGEIVDGLRQAPRRQHRPSYVVDAMIVTLAAVAVYEMVASDGLRPGAPTGAALLLPAALAAAAGVLAVRLLGPLARLAVRATRRRPGVAWYLAIRQVARRPSAARPVLLLVIATALAVTGVTGWWTERTNRELRAGVYLGAATVLHVRAPSNQALLDGVRAADPDGRSAMAAIVYNTLLGSDSAATLYAVDADRLAAVASWRPEWGDGSSAADLATALRRPAPVGSVLVRNGQLGGQLAVHSFQAQAVGSAPAATVVAVLGPPGSAEVGVPVGRLPTVGDRGPLAPPVQVPLAGRVSGCPDGCRLIRLELRPPAGYWAEATGSFELLGLTLDGAPVVPADRAVLGWRAAPYSTPGPQYGVSSAGDAVRYDFGVTSDDRPALIVADTAYPLPVVAARADGLPGPGQPAGGRLPDMRPVDQQVVAVTDVLPGARTVGGRLADLAAVTRLSTRIADGGDQQVWLTALAPPTIRQALTDRGFTIRSEETAVAQAATFARYGPVLAFRGHLAAGLVTLVLAIATVLAVIGLGARRRSWELAAVRTLGISRRLLTRAALIELLLLVGFAVAVGTAVGLAATGITASAVPLAVAAGAPLPAPVPVSGWAPVGVLLLALAGTLVVAGWLAARVLVAAADPSRLREAP